MVTNPHIKRRRYEFILHGLGQDLRHFRNDVAGSDGIGADAARAHLLGYGLCHGDKTGLGGRIVHLAGIPGLAGDGGHIDDAAAFLPGHNGHHGVQEVEGRFHIHGYNCVPLGFCHSHHQAVLGDTGVIDQDIDVAELLLNLGHHGLRFLEVGGVGGIGLHLVAESGNLCHRLLGRFVDDQVCEGDIRPFSGKFKGNGFADSACGARDERYFSV